MFRNRVFFKRFFYISWETIGLLIILSAGLFAYFYNIQTIPPGFYIDEVFPGYNAYSIYKTGKDEYGKFMPLAFRFFGIYNPPLYTYLITPFVYLMGLTKYAVRIPSALFGLITAIAFYFYFRNLAFVRNKLIILLTTLFFIIAPWNILFARTGFEVSLGLMFFALGVVLLQKSLTEKANLKWAMVMLSLSTYSAYSERLLVPMIIIAFVMCFGSALAKSKKQTLLALTVLIIFQLPNILLFFTPAFFPKSDLFYSNILSQSEKIILLPNYLKLSVAFGSEFFSKYFTYFSPKNLFFMADQDMQRSLPELSVLYSWMLIPYVIGLGIIIRNIKSENIKLLTILLLICPLPAALTKDPFATHRAMPMIIPLMIVIGLGINKLYLVNKKMFYSGVWVVLTFSTIFLWRSLFVLLPVERYKYWDYGVEQMVNQISTYKGRVVIDQARGKPLYLHYAFFAKIPPKKVQEKRPGIENNYYKYLGSSPIQTIGNAEFRSIDWAKDVYDSNLLVGDNLTFSKDQIKEHFLTKEFEINGLDGNVIYVAYRTNPASKCTANSDNIKCIDEKK